METDIKKELRYTELGENTRAIKALHASDIRTIEDLITFANQKPLYELMRRSNFGLNSLKVVLAFCEKHNIKLKYDCILKTPKPRNKKTKDKILVRAKHIATFTTFEEWVNKASFHLSGFHKEMQPTLCVDAAGYVLKCGADFQESHDKNRFPVKAYLLTRSSKYNT